MKMWRREKNSQVNELIKNAMSRARKSAFKAFAVGNKLIENECVELIIVNKLQLIKWQALWTEVLVIGVMLKLYVGGLHVIILLLFN